MKQKGYAITISENEAYSRAHELTHDIDQIKFKFNFDIVAISPQPKEHFIIFDTQKRRDIAFSYLKHIYNTVKRPNKPVYYDDKYLTEDFQSRQKSDNEKFLKNMMNDPLFKDFTDDLRAECLKEVSSKFKAEINELKTLLKKSDNEVSKCKEQVLAVKRDKEKLVKMYENKIKSYEKEILSLEHRMKEIIEGKLDNNE